MLLQLSFLFHSAMHRHHSCCPAASAAGHVHLCCCCCQQIGWATIHCPFTAEEGVGDAPDSYAVDGKRLRLAGAQQVFAGTPAWGVGRGGRAGPEASLGHGLGAAAAVAWCGCRATRQVCVRSFGTTATSSAAARHGAALHTPANLPYAYSPASLVNSSMVSSCMCLSRQQSPRMP